MGGSRAVCVVIGYFEEAYVSMIGKTDASTQGFASEIVVAVVAGHVHGLGHVVAIIRSIDCGLEDALSGGLGVVRSWEECSAMNARGSDGLWPLG